MVRKINSLLSFYFKIQSPELLTDQEWSEKWKQLKWVLWFDAERHSGTSGKLEI
jgi:hypothetical protein